jgi:hypothetical protein
MAGRIEGFELNPTVNNPTSGSTAVFDMSLTSPLMQPLDENVAYVTLYGQGQ